MTQNHLCRIHERAIFHSVFALSVRHHQGDNNGKIFFRPDTKYVGVLCRICVAFDVLTIEGEGKRYFTFHVALRRSLEKRSEVSDSKLSCRYLELFPFLRISASINHRRFKVNIERARNHLSNVITEHSASHLHSSMG